MSQTRTRLEFVTCHRYPERSFFWNGRQFPLCARCTGIYVGFCIAPIFWFGWVIPTLLWSVLLILPTAIDGFTQAYLHRESTNWLRMSTGLVAGAGLIMFSSLVGIYIAKGILYCIQ